MIHNEAPLRQITLRNFEPELERCIRNLAREERISLNQAALRLLRRGAGLQGPGPSPVGNTLDFMIGTWTDEDESRFQAANSCFERVDLELWT